MALKQLHTILTKTKRSSIKLISIFHSKNKTSNRNSATITPRSPTNNNRQRRKCKENVANFRVVMNENGEYRLVMRDKENVEDLHDGQKFDGNGNKMNTEKEESGERRKSKKFLRHKSGGNYTKSSFFGLSKAHHRTDSTSAASSTSHFSNTESYQDLTYYSYDDEPSYQEQGPFSQSYDTSNKKSNNKHELRRHSAGCGTIDFEEFIGSLNIKSEDLEDRLQWLFRFYDQDSDGLITRDEMLQIMHAIYN